MTIHLGDVPASSTLYIPFHTFNSSNASVTLTGLAVTDIEIYKNGSVTQRSSDSGYTLLDTDGIDFDGITGIHGFSIDLSDNTDSGFYAVGSTYWVVVSSVTVDSQTVNFVAATFRIRAADVTTGYLPTDVTYISGDATAADNCEAFFDGTGYAGTNNVIPTVTTVTNQLTAGTIADAIWDETQSGHTTAGTFGEIATEIADILADTNELQTDDIPGTLTTIEGKIDTVDTNVDSILVDTGTTIPGLLPSALSSNGNMKCDVLEISSNTTVPATLEETLSAVVTGVCDTGGSTTSIITSSLTPSVTVDDQLIGRIVTFADDTSTAALRGQATDITDSTSAGVLTVTALTTAPASGDKFVIT